MDEAPITPARARAKDDFAIEVPENPATAEAVSDQLRFAINDTISIRSEFNAGKLDGATSAAKIIALGAATGELLKKLLPGDDIAARLREAGYEAGDEYRGVATKAVQRGLEAAIHHETESVTTEEAGELIDAAIEDAVVALLGAKVEGE